MLEKIYSINDAEFATYGRVITDLDTTEIIEVAKKIENPKEGSAYMPSVKEFEELKIFKEIENKYFGTMPSQLGYCWGQNSVMNAMEYHCCNEINVAITPLVLILGHTWDIKDMKVNSSTFRAFYVPQGAAVEIYSTSLHFCPCQTEDAGFGCVVGLLKGTNVPIENAIPEKPLFKQNKWIFAHVDNTDLIEKGIVAGITGENLTVSCEK